MSAFLVLIASCMSVLRVMMASCMSVFLVMIAYFNSISPECKVISPECNEIYLSTFISCLRDLDTGFTSCLIFWCRVCSARTQWVLSPKVPASASSQCSIGEPQADWENNAAALFTSLSVEVDHHKQTTVQLKPEAAGLCSSASEYLLVHKPVTLAAPVPSDTQLPCSSACP
jgi:hypothetical protein